MRARIHKPPRTAMQSGWAKTKQWVLEFEPAEKRVADPLMGWIGSGDTLSSQVRLRFPTREAAIAYAEANLGVVAPFIGVAYGSGDDDPTDTDLEGFHQHPNSQNSSAITGTQRFSHLDRTVGFAGRDIKTPARAAGSNGVFGGSQFAHSVGQPFHDRLGNRAHPGLVTTLSNPGLLAPFAGVQVFPAQGHEIDFSYIYQAMMDVSVVRAGIGGVPLSKALYHSLNAQWEWTFSRHFDFRLAGSVIIPAEGVKDIARTSRTFPCTAADPCQGEDVALQGEVRVRARF